MVASDKDSTESEKQPPPPCPSVQQQKPMLGCAGNEESQDVSTSSSIISINYCPPSSNILLRELPQHYHPWLRMEDPSTEDIDDISGDSPTTNDQSDCSDVDYYFHNPINRWDDHYRFIHGRDRRYCGPIRNFNDQRDHSDGDYNFDNPINRWDDRYQFPQGRGRRNCANSCCCNARRNHWDGGYPFLPGFINLRNPMASVNIEHGSRWSSPERDHGKKRYNVGAALFNPHRWTCFLNCILQCMVHTVPLVLKLQNAYHPYPCPRASIGFCCYCSLKLHIDESIRLSGSAFYPDSFVNCLSSISPEFTSFVQQDAHEFLRCLLEKLDDASVAPMSSLEEPSSTEEGSVAKEIFGGRLKSQLRCVECNRCSDKYEPFLDLSLEVNMVDTLMDAFQSFTKVELIEDFMCDGCQSRVNMEKHLKVEQAPEVLVIHLKRFINSGVDIYKIWNKVECPLELDINPFVSPSDDTSQKYDLYGVVEHLGQYGKGHYVCYIRSSEADWYKFNDDKVSRFSEDDVLNGNAYILFYAKQGSSPWFSTLLDREDKVPLDSSERLAEEGFSELALLNNKEEESTSHGQGGPDYCLGGRAEENEYMPSLPDFSQHLQRDANGNILLDAVDKLEGCVQGGSQRKNEDNRNLLQLSHKHEDNYDHTNFSLQEDEIVGSSRASSIRMCTPEKKTTVESISNHELRNGNNGTNGGEEGRGGGGKKRKRRKPPSADGESKASRRKHRAVADARHFHLCRRRAWPVAAKLNKRPR
ncbi:ubiquitin carboxyl-terminal hydrolase 19-like [Phragmites australis]|uniref:ubiquitin carboxyl-terminal hydrolase 19-like n=1 Tax=Phragmites australis TaxID=29695 RepID=UPI002D77FB38|nr:ubiquitin carboxyl-terminal hydrolase 19-like [Phragmites australis]